MKLLICRAKHSANSARVPIAAQSMLYAQQYNLELLFDTLRPPFARVQFILTIIRAYL